MAVRASMSDIILRTRRLMGNAYADVFDDQQIQDALDRWRSERRWVPLTPQPTFAPGSTILYYDYYSDAQHWEADVVMQDTSYTTITPDLSELEVGHWHFAQQPNGVAVRATGKTYDLYASAADLLEMWAGQVMLDFDFSDGVTAYQRSQKYTAIMALAASYRAKAQPHTSRMVQTDAMPDHDGGGVTYSSVSEGVTSYGP